MAEVKITDIEAAFISKGAKAAMALVAEPKKLATPDNFGFESPMVNFTIAWQLYFTHFGSGLTMSEAFQAAGDIGRELATAYDGAGLDAAVGCAAARGIGKITYHLHGAFTAHSPYGWNVRIVPVVTVNK